MSDLTGKRVIVTRPAAQASSMCHALEQENAQPILFPTVQIVPLEPNTEFEQILCVWDSFDWVVFTSVNGVKIFYDRAKVAGVSLRQQLGRPRLAAIGPATARELVARGGTVGCMPNEYVAEGIVRSLGEVGGQRILLARAKKARRILAEQLSERGAEVVEVAIYDVIQPTPPPNIDQALSAGADIITFTSSSTVEGWLRILGERAHGALQQCCVACIGPITADTARRNDISVDVVATEYTTDGLIQALVSHFTS